MRLFPSKIDQVIEFFVSFLFKNRFLCNISSASYKKPTIMTLGTKTQKASLWWWDFLHCEFATFEQWGPHTKNGKTTLDSWNFLTYIKRDTKTYKYYITLENLSALLDISIPSPVPRSIFGMGKIQNFGILASYNNFEGLWKTF